jgi:hypothetical protein
LLIVSRTMGKLHDGWWIAPAMLVLYCAFDWLSKSIVKPAEQDVTSE